MKFYSSDTLHHSRDRVYALYRDELEAIGAASPDLDSIKITSVQEREDGVLVKSVWRAADLFRGMVPKDMLTWEVEALWRSYQNEWTLRPRIFADRVQCRGLTRFDDQEGSCGVVIEGDLVLKMPFDRIVERVVVRLLPKNLKRINETLHAMLLHGADASV